MVPSRALKYILVIPILYFLFFFALGHVGLLGPDEPRYAAIGREMARSGDWITPRLWGEPWFEKPALLYWLTGLAFRAGLSADLAPRLPVAIIGVAFLIFYYATLRREFGERAAWFATAILGTSAAWLGFSAIAVTDLPMSAAFSGAMLVLVGQVHDLPPDRAGRGPAPLWAGAFLGIAVLAKGLVPLVLALPALWIARKHLWKSLIACVAVALPWYLLCTLRNGNAFLTEFFWKHHFERFTSGALMHAHNRCGITCRSCWPGSSHGRRWRRCYFAGSCTPIHAAGSCCCGSPSASSSFRWRRTSFPATYCRSFPRLPLCSVCRWRRLAGRGGCSPVARCF